MSLTLDVGLTDDQNNRAQGGIHPSLWQLPSTRGIDHLAHDRLTLLKKKNINL